jgi:transcriptional regulator with XRE-family HTH domain
MQLYEKIPLLRKAKGMTQAELADALNVSRQSVQKWETGLTCPDIAKLPDLARAFGVSTDALLDANLGGEDLLALAHRHANPAPETSSAGAGAQNAAGSGRRSMLDYLLMLPIGLGLALVVGMFYLFGAMFAGIWLCIAFFSLCSAGAAVVVIFINAANGIGATLIAIAGVFLGLGCAAPFYYLARLWWQTYVRLARRLTARLRAINWKGIIR